MRPKSLMLLALALGCGLVASIGISQIMEHNKRPQGTLETVPIYIAKHNINLGDPIDAAMLSLQEWPKDKVPRGAISDLKDLEGRRPRAAIFEGEALLDNKLLAPGQVADPIRSIAPGMRLKTIAVDAEKSAAGLLGPGDRVDVQLFVKADARNGITQAQSKVILQNIRVFAVDATVQRSPDGGDEKTVAKTVSLMLTPEQASRLTLAENLGIVSLIPRNPDDESIGDVASLTPDDIFSGNGQANNRKKEQGATETEEPKADHGSLATIVEQAAPPPEPPFQMEVIEREAVRMVAFDRQSGRPIRDPSTSATTGPAVGSSAAGGVTGSTTSAGTSNSKAKMEDFPINFNQSSK